MWCIDGGSGWQGPREIKMALLRVYFFASSLIYCGKPSQKDFTKKHTHTYTFFCFVTCLCYIFLLHVFVIVPGIIQQRPSSCNEEIVPRIMVYVVECFFSSPIKLEGDNKHHTFYFYFFIFLIFWREG